MSIPPINPGIYVSEDPLGRPTITAVETSIAAFVGQAARGPLDEPVPIASFPEFERIFGGLWVGSGMGYALRDFFGNDGRFAVVVRVARSATTAAVDVDGLRLVAADPGAWANDMRVWVSHPDADPREAARVARAQGDSASDLFSLRVQSGPAEARRIEEFHDVTVVEGPRRVDQVLEASTLVRVDGALPGARPGQLLPDEAVPDGGAAYAPSAATQGDDGDPPDETAYTHPPASEAARTGIYALLKTDLFSILVLPPPTPDSDLPVAVWAPAVAFCARQRAFCLVDPPVTATLDSVATWATSTAGLTGTDARNAAVYFPRILGPDPLHGGAPRAFAASGAIAGVYARTDATRGVWRAPAGTNAELRGALGLSVPLTDAGQDRLNPLGINELRTRPGMGPVVWGARTLRGFEGLADEYKYVPVRRLALFIEESLHRGTGWAVFEPNDQQLWSALRACIDTFMYDLFVRGGLLGASAREAWFVRCDEQTTTQSDIERGVVNVVVGFAPLKPAEFVIITIRVNTAPGG